MSFVERFSILCPYLGESTIEGSTVCPANGTFPLKHVYICSVCLFVTVSSFLYMYTVGPSYDKLS